MYVYIYIHNIYTHTHIYIYIYIYTDVHLLLHELQGTLLTEAFLYVQSSVRSLAMASGKGGRRRMHVSCCGGLLL